MADNTLLNLGTGGDTIRDIDRGSGVKTQVVQIDGGGAGGESLVSPAKGLSVSVGNPEVIEVLRQVLIELRVMNGMLQDGINPGRSLGNTTLDNLRFDEDIAINLVG